MDPSGLIIDEFGGWDRFQALLATLARVGARHGCDIATVATRVVLDWPHVAAAIVGATNAAQDEEARAKAEDIRIAYAQNQRWGSVLI